MVRRETIAALIAARISASSRTNSETREARRLAASRLNSIPPRVKVIVVRVINTAKSSRRGPQLSSASADASASPMATQSRRRTW